MPLNNALIDVLLLDAIVLLDLTVGTNAIVLRNLAQHKVEAGADVPKVLPQGGLTGVRFILMTATATILALTRWCWSATTASSQPAWPRW